MATKSSVAKQKKRERLVKSHWQTRQRLKEIVRDQTKGMEDRLEAQMKLSRLPRNSSPVRLRNRCLMTGRARGYLRKFKLSRLCFREMARMGMIPGLVKASW